MVSLVQALSSVLFCVVGIMLFIMGTEFHSLENFLVHIITTAIAFYGICLIMFGIAMLINKKEQEADNAN